MLRSNNKEINEDLLGILDSLNNNNSHNLNKSKRVINDLFSAYVG